VDTAYLRLCPEVHLNSYGLSSFWSLGQSGARRQRWRDDVQVQNGLWSRDYSSTPQSCSCSHQGFIKSFVFGRRRARVRGLGYSRSSANFGLDEWSSIQFKNARNVAYSIASTYKPWQNIASRQQSRINQASTAIRSNVRHI
jgi:hypothetical protein